MEHHQSGPVPSDDDDDMISVLSGLSKGSPEVSEDSSTDDSDIDHPETDTTDSSSNGSDGDGGRQSSKTCKCTTFVKQPDLPGNVLYPCAAYDIRYSVNYRCARRAQVVLTNGLLEKIYCQSHASLFRDHRQCQYCRAFCYQGLFLICTGEHWMDTGCARLKHQRCSHCGTQGPHVERWNFHMENSELSTKLSEMVFEYNTGKQLNLVSLCTADQKRYLLEILEGIRAGSPRELAGKSLPDMVKSADHYGLMGYILRNVFSSESNDWNKDVYTGIDEALRCNDGNLALLIILQFIDIRPRFENLMLAVEQGNVRAVNVLLHHGAPLRPEDNDVNCGNILKLALNLRKFAVANEIFKFLAKNENTINGTSLIFDAIEMGDLEVLQNLLQNGANVCVQDEHGDGLLHKLAKNLHKNGLEMAKTICSNGMAHIRNGFVDAVNTDGQTALSLADDGNNPDFVELLLDYGANPDGIQKPGLIGSSALERYRHQFQLRHLLTSNRHYITRDLTMGRERRPITVENSVGDGAVLDPDFQYSSTILDLDAFRCQLDFSLACHCDGACEVPTCPCCSQYAYDPMAHGLNEKSCKLAQQQQLGIVLECNTGCFCTGTSSTFPSCPSRLAQHGIRTDLEVFRTARYGWAVRSAMPIQRGEFICEYTGELISGEEADKREDDNYLFEIIDDSASSYCIDAKHYGNISRFINHSCEANLMVVRVVWDANIRHFPHVCFFAGRNISKGEELTIDYGKQWWDVKLEKFSCRCGSKGCRYDERTRQRLLQDNIGI